MTTANTAQKEYWNQTMGPTWVELQAQLDRQIRPLGEAAMRALAPAAAEAILDLGCGCGESTLALAAAVGPAGVVTGVDISRPMLEVARARPVPEGSARPDFYERDAQSDDLGEGCFDGAFSRFGVMFFQDPAAAFGNIRRALRSGGRLAFVCWRAFAENAWMRAPWDAAAPLLPPQPAPDPNAPGPFAFADPVRVRTILTEAGWSAIQIDPFDTPIGGSELDAAVALAFRVGPLATVARENPGVKAKVEPAVRAALSPYLVDGRVMVPGAVWIVRATNPA